MHKIVCSKTIFILIIKAPLFNIFDNFLIQKCLNQLHFVTFFTKCNTVMPEN